MVNTPFPWIQANINSRKHQKNIVKVEYDDWSGNTSCEIADSGKVTCQGDNSDEGMLFGKENKALPYSANPLKISGEEQAKSFT